mgnify:CR=1 FL=1
MFIADPALRRPPAASRSLRSESIFAPATERWLAVLGILVGRGTSLTAVSLLRGSQAARLRRFPRSRCLDVD